jgi:hypothetical protein
VKTMNSDGDLECRFCGCSFSAVDAELVRNCYLVGAVTGGSVGLASVWAGAEAGTAIGAALGPVGVMCGGVVGALIAAGIGAAAGGTVGANVGAKIDSTQPKSRKCPNCGAVHLVEGVHHGA